MQSSRTSQACASRTCSMPQSTVASARSSCRVRTSPVGSEHVARRRGPEVDGPRHRAGLFINETAKLATCSSGTSFLEKTHVHQCRAPHQPRATAIRHRPASTSGSVCDLAEAMALRCAGTPRVRSWTKSPSSPRRLRVCPSTISTAWAASSGPATTQTRRHADHAPRSFRARSRQVHPNAVCPD